MAQRLSDNTKILNNPVDLRKPVLWWLEKRARYVSGTDGLEWVERDSIVGCMFPMLYVLDEGGGRVHLSESVRQRAWRAYLETHARWLIREKRLGEILALLGHENINVIPMKGGILQSQLYRDSGLRRMSDIDILISEPQYLQAVEILWRAGLGLHPDNGFDAPAVLRGRPFSTLPAEIKFVDDKNSGLVLEIHRHLITSPWLIPGFGVNLDEIWERAMPATRDVNPHGLWKIILSPYDTLVSLTLHLALHGLQAMQTYLDIDLWVRSLPDSWDWEQFLELVNLGQIRSATYHALSFCKYFMDTPLPDGILSRIDPGWLARLRVNLLISAQSLLADRRGLGRRYPTLVKLALVDRLPGILLTLIKLAFPDRTWRETNPNGRNLLAHWLHILQVVRRGD